MGDSFTELVSKKKVIHAVLRILDKHINDSKEYPLELFTIKREILDALSKVDFYYIESGNGGSENG